MRPAFRRGWEGEGESESMPWRGPAGKARHTGVSIPVRGTRGQSPWRSSSGIAWRSSQNRPPCNGAKPPDALRARKCASGRPAMREARVPAGQHRKRCTLRSAQRGTECVLQNSRSTSMLLIVTRMGRDYRPGPRQWIEQVALRAARWNHFLIKSLAAMRISGSVAPQQAIDRHCKQHC